MDGRTRTVNWDHTIMVMIKRQNFWLRTESVGRSSNNVSTGSRNQIRLECIGRPLIVTIILAEKNIWTTNVLWRKFTTGDPQKSAFSWPHSSSHSRLRYHYDKMLCSELIIFSRYRCRGCWWEYAEQVRQWCGFYSKNFFNGRRQRKIKF